MQLIVPLDAPFSVKTLSNFRLFNWAQIFVEIKMITNNNL